MILQTSSLLTYLGRTVWLYTSNMHLRTDAGFLNQMYDDDHQLSKSILSELDVGLVTQVPLDYMHLVCLGVVKKLYLGPVVLRGVLSKTLYMHFLLLHCAIYILCTANICQNDEWRQYASNLLHCFVRYISDLYSNEFLVYNVHNLLHLAGDADNFGHLDRFSAFPFENFMSKIKNMVRGHNMPLEQVAKRLGENCNFETKNIPKTKPIKERNGQIRKIHHNGYVIGTSPRDSCFVTSNDDIVIVKSILETDVNSFILTCDCFVIKTDFYKEPIQSSKREWVCDRAAYAPFAQSVFFVGSLCGVALFGYIGDKYGRLPAFIGANIIGFIGNISTIFTVGAWDFALARFISGVSNDACYTMIYIIILEFIGTRHRTWVSNAVMGVAFSGAQVLLPVLALYLADWKTLTVVTSLPALLALATPWIVPESVRWLSSTGKVKRALKILKRFEKINNSQIPQDVINEFVKTSHKKRESDESLVALFQTPKLRNCLLVLILVSIIASVGIDAIIRLSENIGSSLFVTFAASSVAEIPAMAFVTVTLDRYGRRAVIATTLALTSVFSFVCAAIPRGIFQAVVAVTLRLFVNMSYSSLVQLGPEVLPTPVRSSGNSLIHITIFLATVLSPYVVYSGTVWVPLPLTIIGAISVVGTLFSLLLPETKGLPMPQTLADGERLVVENMLCGRVEIDEDTEKLPPLKQKM